jgi:hypothetical protein
MNKWIYGIIAILAVIALYGGYQTFKPVAKVSDLTNQINTAKQDVTTAKSTEQATEKQADKAKEAVITVMKPIIGDQQRRQNALERLRAVETIPTIPNPSAQAVASKAEEIVPVQAEVIKADDALIIDQESAIGAMKELNAAMQAQVDAEKAIIVKQDELSVLNDSQVAGLKSENADLSSKLRWAKIGFIAIAVLLGAHFLVVL